MKKSSKLIELKRKIKDFDSDEDFFELHSQSYGVRKMQNMGQNDHFAANYRKFKRLRILVNGRKHLNARLFMSCASSEEQCDCQ